VHGRRLYLARGDAGGEPDPCRRAVVRSEPPRGSGEYRGPVFAIYGELDQRINAGIETIRREMQSHGKPFTHTIYPGAQHAFNNDTNPERYHPEQARIAWTDMLEFFARHLES